MSVSTRESARAREPEPGPGSSALGGEAPNTRPLQPGLEAQSLGCTGQRARRQGLQGLRPQPSARLQPAPRARGLQRSGAPAGQAGELQLAKPRPSGAARLGLEGGVRNPAWLETYRGRSGGNLRGGSRSMRCRVAMEGGGIEGRAWGETADRASPGRRIARVDEVGARGGRGAGRPRKSKGEGKRREGWDREGTRYTNTKELSSRYWALRASGRTGDGRRWRVSR